MMILGWPQEILFNRLLGAWTALDSGVSVAAQSNTTTQATVWVQASSSVTEGEIYDVQCKLTTVGGRIDHRTLRIVIRRR